MAEPAIASTQRTSSRTRVRIPPTSFDVLSEWTVKRVRSAILAHECGDFYLSALLADALLRDPDIFRGINTRTSAFSARNGLPFTIEPAEGVDARREKSVAERQRRLWWACCPETAISAIERDAIFLGVAVGRDDTQKIAGEWVPLVRRLRPHGLRWSETESTFRYLDGNGIDHVVTPGENGWILHAPHGGDSWMLGAVRALGQPAIIDLLTLRDFARYCERHGMPALAIKEPFMATDDVEGPSGSAGADDFYKDLRKLPQEATLRLPRGQDGTDGWDAQWLELKSRSFEAFEKLLTELRRRILAVLLGREADGGGARVGGDGASYIENVRGEYLAAEAEALSTTLREQVWMPDTRRNIDANRPELTGWPRWDTRPPADLAKRATTLNTAGDAIDKLERQGVNTDPVVVEFGLARRPGWKPPPSGEAAPLPAPIEQGTQ
jgi:phage gp29-like protein